MSIAIALCAASASARADGVLHDLANDIRARLAAAAQAHAVKLVPPVPIAVKYKPARLGSLDLGAPLVALDRCEPHGVWFDAKELADLLGQAKKFKDKSSPGIVHIGLLERLAGLFK